MEVLSYPMSVNRCPFWSFRRIFIFADSRIAEFLLCRISDSLKFVMPNLVSLKFSICPYWYLAHRSAFHRYVDSTEFWHNRGKCCDLLFEFHRWRQFQWHCARTAAWNTVFFKDRARLRIRPFTFSPVFAAVSTCPKLSQQITTARTFSANNCVV